MTARLKHTCCWPQSSSLQVLGLTACLSVSWLPAMRLGCVHCSVGACKDRLSAHYGGLWQQLAASLHHAFRLPAETAHEHRGQHHAFMLPAEEFNFDIMAPCSS